MLVSLKPNDAQTVQPLSSNNVDRMSGVVVPLNNAPIVLMPQTTTSQQVLVASSGRYQLLVSNQNGDIVAGDYLTVSALDGIAMKSDTSSSQVVGRAVANFNSQTNVIGQMNLKAGSTSQTVSIGSLTADVKLAPNPNFNKDKNLSGFLAKLANGVTQESVSTARLYLAALALVSSFIITGILIYGAVRNGFVSIGRNPLARFVIYRGLVQIIIIGLLIISAGAITSYLILKI